MASRNNNLPPPDSAQTGPERQEQALLQSQGLWALADALDLDLKQRQFIWPGDRRLSLTQSAEHIRKEYPQLRAGLVEAFLVAHIENYAPEGCTRQALEEIDHLAEVWLGELEDLHEQDA